MFFDCVLEGIETSVDCVRRPRVAVALAEAQARRGFSDFLGLL